MSGILDLLSSDIGKSIISGTAGQTNQPENKTNDVLTMALPVLMAAMKQNASSPQGAEGLMSALSYNKHDGSILDNLDGFFRGGVDESVMQDGSKILGHVLGAKQQNVENAIGARTGIDSNTIAQILKIAAPILLGMLGKQTREKQVNNSSGLEDLLGGMLSGNSPQHEQSFLESILDADGDGSIIDDVAGMMLSGNKKKGGFAGMFGSFFGK